MYGRRTSTLIDNKVANVKEQAADRHDLHAYRYSTWRLRCQRQDVRETAQVPEDPEHLYTQ